MRWTPWPAHGPSCTRRLNGDRPHDRPALHQPRHIADAPVALAASIAAQAQTRELNALRTERDTLLNALRQIALTEACSNSDPEVMGKALDNCVAIAQGALRACQQRVRCTVPPEASAIGATLDPESIEQGDPT